MTRHQNTRAESAFQFKPRLASLAVAACFVAHVGSALANPTGAQVVAGSAQFATNGNTLSVTNTPNAIINWQQFNIAAGETTRFIQQSANSAVLNRVVGNNLSQIYGTLQSNGQVYLVNQNGIIFGNSAVIDVNKLVASTLNLSDSDFLNKRFSFSGGGFGSILNQGSISTALGGSVYLIGSDVRNEGIITSPQGQVVLAAGNTVSLVDTAGPELTVTISANGNKAVNLGTVNAAGGGINMFGALIEQQGVLRADSASVDEQGRIVLKATDSTTVSGTLSAANSAGQGGEILVLGDKVTLTATANLNASGTTGGGTVLVGGDWQGKNAAVQNATTTTMQAGAVINASATDNGDGGKVVLWSNNATDFKGSIFARGGALGGNGGAVETSGKSLLIGGLVDSRAPNGKGGKWLLDPSAFCFDVTSTPGTACSGTYDPVTHGYTTQVSSGIDSTPNSVLYMTPTDLDFALSTNGSVYVQATDYAAIFPNGGTYTAGSAYSIPTGADLQILAPHIYVGGTMDFRTNSVPLVLTFDTTGASTSFPAASYSSLILNGSLTAPSGSSVNMYTKALEVGSGATMDLTKSGGSMISLTGDSDIQYAAQKIKNLGGTVIANTFNWSFYSVNDAASTSSLLMNVNDVVVDAVGFQLSPGILNAFLSSSDPSIVINASDYVKVLTAGQSFNAVAGGVAGTRALSINAPHIGVEGTLNFPNAINLSLNTLAGNSTNYPTASYSNLLFNGQLTAASGSNVSLNTNNMEFGVNSLIDVSKTLGIVNLAAPSSVLNVKNLGGTVRANNFNWSFYDTNTTGTSPLNLDVYSLAITASMPGTLYIGRPDSNASCSQSGIMCVADITSDFSGTIPIVNLSYTGGAIHYEKSVVLPSSTNQLVISSPYNYLFVDGAVSQSIGNMYLSAQSVLIEAPLVNTGGSIDLDGSHYVEVKPNSSTGLLGSVTASGGLYLFAGLSPSASGTPGLYINGALKGSRVSLNASFIPARPGVIELGTGASVTATSQLSESSIALHGHNNPEIQILINENCPSCGTATFTNLAGANVFLSDTGLGLSTTGNWAMRAQNTTFNFGGVAHTPMTPSEFGSWYYGPNWSANQSSFLASNSTKDFLIGSLTAVSGGSSSSNTPAVTDPCVLNPAQCTTTSAEKVVTTVATNTVTTTTLSAPLTIDAKLTSDERYTINSSLTSAATTISIESVLTTPVRSDEVKTVQEVKAEAVQSRVEASKAETDAKRAEAEAKQAEGEAKSAKTPEKRAEAQKRADTKKVEAEVKKAQAEAKRAEAEARDALAESKQVTGDETKVVSNSASGKPSTAATPASTAKRAEAEAKVARAEGKRAEAEAKRADAEAKQATQEAKSAKTPEQKEVAQKTAEAKKVEADAKRTESQSRKLESEAKQAEAEAKTAATPQARAAAEKRAETKKNESEVKKAESEGKLASAEGKQAEVKTKQAEMEAKQAEAEARTAKTPEQKLAATQKAEVKKTEAQAHKSEGEGKKAAAEGKKIEAEAKKAEGEAKKAEADAKSAKTPEKKAEAEKRAESKKVEAEVKKTEAEGKKAESESKQAQSEAKQAEADAKGTRSPGGRAVAEKQRDAKQAESEHKKAESEQKKAESEHKQAQAEAKEAKTPAKKAEAEKKAEQKRAEVEQKKVNADKKKAEADKKQAEHKVAAEKRKDERRAEAAKAFAAVSSASMSRADLVNMLALRHDLKTEALKPALSILDKNPGAADLPSCSSGAAVCVPDAARLPSNLLPQPMVPKFAALPQIQRKVAIVVGVNKYSDSSIPSLETALPDAEAVGKQLRDQMGYDVKVVPDASRADIVNSLNKLSQEVGPNDSVTVYYAGHGYLNTKTDTGYWIPADAKVSSPDNWISNNDIARLLNAIPAKQVMLVSDSCYSGSLTKEQKVMAGAGTLDPSGILAKRSVTVMSSGGEEPVSDEGKDGHSIFAYSLMNSLKSVNKFESGAKLFESIRNEVTKEFPQTPQYGGAKSAGHSDGGDYLLEARSYK